MSDTDEDAGGDRKIEGKALPLDRNIAGQMSQPWQLAGER